MLNEQLDSFNELAILSKELLKKLKESLNIKVKLLLFKDYFELLFF